MNRPAGYATKLRSAKLDTRNITVGRGSAARKHAYIAVGSKQPCVGSLPSQDTVSESFNPTNMATLYGVNEEGEADMSVVQRC